MPDAPRIVASSPGLKTISRVGAITCRAPTKRLKIPAARGSTFPRSIRPLRKSTAPTYRSPTDPIDTHLLAPRTGGVVCSRPRQARQRRVLRCSPPPLGSARDHLGCFLTLFLAGQRG